MYLAVAVVAFAGMMLGGTDRAAAAISMDWVTVGNPGNQADPLTGHGAVDEAYRIGKTEVTNAQYVEFLNAVASEGDPHGLYNDFMSSVPQGGITHDDAAGNYSYTVKPNMANRPVNMVSLFDAMRFTNWMHNGQGAADTETGAYDMSLKENATRSEDAKFFLPTLDEWYKAAYHGPTREESEYWLYPTRSNDKPTAAIVDATTGAITNPGENVANYQWDPEAWSEGVSIVGSADDPNTDLVESASFYGTFDQGGNVNEWIGPDGPMGARGGSFKTKSDGRNAFHTQADAPFVLGEEQLNLEWDAYGFRLAAPVPEPATAMLFGLAAPLLLRRRR